MQASIAGNLKREFIGRSDAAAYHRFQQMQREERAKRERRDEADADASDLLDMAALIVSEAEVRDFSVELSRYDAAAIEALHQNEIDLTRARDHLDQILAKAHVLPDGRRVFKTEDGMRIFDEHGSEMNHDEIAPDEIADERPRWETAKEAIDTLEALTQERAELLEYQQKLDGARERLDAGDMTRDEFDTLRDDLRSDMPQSMRDQFPDLAAEEKAEPVAAVDHSTSEIVLDISDDMVPSGMAKGLIPG